MAVTFKNFFRGLAQAAPVIADMIIVGRQREIENRRAEDYLNLQREQLDLQKKESASRIKVYETEADLTKQRVDIGVRAVELNENIMNKIREIEYIVQLPDPAKRDAGIKKANRELDSLIEESMIFNNQYGDVISMRQKNDLQKASVLGSLFNSVVAINVNWPELFKTMKDKEYESVFDFYEDIISNISDPTAQKQFLNAQSTITEVRKFLSEELTKLNTNIENRQVDPQTIRKDFLAGELPIPGSKKIEHYATYNDKLKRYEVKEDKTEEFTEVVNNYFTNSSQENQYLRFMGQADILKMAFFIFKESDVFAAVPGATAMLEHYQKQARDKKTEMEREEEERRKQQEEEERRRREAGPGYFSGQPGATGLPGLVGDVGKSLYGGMNALEMGYRRGLPEAGRRLFPQFGGYSVPTDTTKTGR